MKKIVSGFVFLSWLIAAVFAQDAIAQNTKSWTPKQRCSPRVRVTSASWAAGAAY